MDLINIKELGGIFPHIIYQRIQVNNPEMFYAEKIPMSYGYIIRRIFIKYPSKVAPLPAVDPEAFFYAPRLKLEFLEISSHKVRQPSPLPIDLFSSPVMSGDSYMATAPSPVDNEGFGLNNSASGTIRYSSILNYLLVYGDQVWLRITEQVLQTEVILSTPVTFWNPGYIDLIVDGYMVPEEKFSVTKGGKP